MSKPSKKALYHQPGTVSPVKQELRRQARTPAVLAPSTSYRLPSAQRAAMLAALASAVVPPMRRTD